jgi:hypothetical protein
MMTKRLAKVGVVYSDNTRQSTESKHLAHYLCGLLTAGGWANVFMIPFSADGPISDTSSSGRILYVPPRQNKPLEVPVSLVSMGMISFTLFILGF